MDMRSSTQILIWLSVYLFANWSCRFEFHTHILRDGLSNQKGNLEENMAVKMEPILQSSFRLEIKRNRK